MSDKFYRIPIRKLFNWILTEEKEGKIFGIYKELFFTPKSNDVFKIKRYEKILETPLGVAAGPHTQLAQNIIGAWLCGARYIELKTVQMLDEIKVTKPCIDMKDEGYNCEWSQELKIEDSFDEYLNAWIIIHILKHKFGWHKPTEAGFIFNMSAGYDMAGMLKPNVQMFLNKMKNCEKEKNEKLDLLADLYPAIYDIDIPNQISDNITLSTMHGCPPDEIETIAKYLIEEQKLHTAIKLNPTLLGKEKVKFILNDKLGYNIKVPDEAFEHDLQYEEALTLIKFLENSASKSGVEFGLKLTNTLETLNTAGNLPSSEKTLYMSGRVLHPISINLAEKLQSDFNGKLDISFSAGIDCFNAVHTLACNIKPITVCSDLLKPGGYTRLKQYLENIENDVRDYKANSVDEFICSKADVNNVKDAGLANLRKYSKEVLGDKKYFKSSFAYDNVKTDRALTAYDCVKAPCISTCAISQDVPEYMYYTSKGDYENAYNVIVNANPLPNITGMVCDHLCQSKCTRINYDSPLLIREIKRFIAEKHKDGIDIKPSSKNGIKAAIIGAGPSGLSCAYFLILAGFEVHLYERKNFAGGMASDAIPSFRLSDTGIEQDINNIISLGVNVHYNYDIDEEKFQKLRNEFEYIYVAVGAQRGKRLEVPGENAAGIMDQLNFLSSIRRGQNLILGKKIGIIGGGNACMDAARTAHRLAGKDGDVTVIYRRTKNEMPADKEEIEALLQEGIKILELTAPEKINVENGHVKSITCSKMKLGDVDNSSRPRPIKVNDSEFEMEVDSIITAIGQDVVVDFLPDKILKINNITNETQFNNVFAGGDAVRGADSLINAISDGKIVAQEIINKVSQKSNTFNNGFKKKLDSAGYQKKQAYRIYGSGVTSNITKDHLTFDLVHPTLDEVSAKKEADRCLFCSDVCNTCVSVCPNFANTAFVITPRDVTIQHVVYSGDKIQIEDIDTLRIQQENQIINIGNFCNECGNCTTFCPTSGAPYKMKPKFYLTEESFNKEDGGYYLENKSIKFKLDNKVNMVKEDSDCFIFENEDVRAKFDLNKLRIIDIAMKNKNIKQYNSTTAVEMIVLYMALQEVPLFRV